MPPPEPRPDPPSLTEARGPRDGVVRIFRDRSGRNGKVVTVIRGLPAKDLEHRATELKRFCGAGGAVKDGAVEIQGDHRETIVAELVKLGWPAKKSGG